MQFLKTQFHLDPDELAEVAGETFSPLDAHYLEFCLLLRDAAQALDVAGRSPLDRATAAFAWVVRQVRLEERRGGQFPPQFILQRGWGTLGGTRRLSTWRCSRSSAWKASPSFSAIRRR